MSVWKCNWQRVENWCSKIQISFFENRLYKNWLPIKKKQCTWWIYVLFTIVWTTNLFRKFFVFSVCRILLIISDVMLSVGGLDGQAIWVPVADSSARIFTKWCYIWSLGWGMIQETIKIIIFIWKKKNQNWMQLNFNITERPIQSDFTHLLYRKSCLPL